MAAEQIQDLFPHVRNPENTRVVNDRCLVRTQDGYCVVIVSGIVLVQYATMDRMAEAYAMVSLVEQGWADQNDVARAFDCSVRTVRRHQQRFADGGLAALGHRNGYPLGRRRLRAARTRLIHRLKTQGHANREIARRLGVSEMAIRKLLRRLGLERSRPRSELAVPEIPSAWDLLSFEQVGDRLLTNDDSVGQRNPGNLYVGTVVSLRSDIRGVGAKEGVSLDDRRLMPSW